MKRILLAAAVSAVLTTNPVLADSSLEERVQRLEQLLGNLQGRVDKQDRIITRQDQTIQQQGKVIERQADVIDGQQKQLAEGAGKSSGVGSKTWK